jgi:hypothetical protein
LLPGVALAQRTFTEDFTTTAYRDSGPTSAVWDTLAGELRLVPFTPSTAGSIALASPAHTVAVHDGLAYIGTTGSGLQIYDIADPSAAVFVGSFTAYNNIEDIAFVGKMALLAVGSGDLVVVDVSDPTASMLNFVLSIGGSTHAVAVDGFDVFIAAGSAGLAVFNITAGSTDYYTATAAVQDVVIDGDEAYLALANGQVEALNITNPQAPVLMKAVSVGVSAEALELSGNWLYAAAGTNGLQALDITLPVSMAVGGSLALSGNAVDVAVSSDVAFVAAGVSGVHQVDITDPSLPVETTVHPTTGSSEGVAPVLQHLLIADGNGGLVLRKWARDTGILSIGSVENLTLQLPEELVIRGDWGYFISNSNFEIVDLSNPAIPSIAHTLALSGTAATLDLAGNNAYIDVSGSGLQVVDITQPTVPFVSGILGLSSTSRKAVVEGNQLYQVWSTAGASGGAGFRILDISTPTVPVAVVDTMFISSPSTFQSLDVDGDVVCIAAESDGLWVVNVGNPTAPVVKSTLPVTVGAIADVVVDGHHAYCAARTGGLVIYDLTSETQVGTLVGPQAYTKIVKAGNRVYLAGSTEIRVMEVADPTAPVMGSSYGSVLQDVLRVDGTRLYTLSRFSGQLQVFDLVNPYWDPTQNYGQSVPVDGEDKTIAAFRLQVTGTGNPQINVSAVGYPTGNFVPYNGGFETLNLPGTDLIWDAFLPTNVSTPSTLTSLTIDWLIQEPEITSITDVPDDQGGWARLRFTPSAYDRLDTGSFAPIAGYNIHRRIDNAATASRILSQGEAVTATEAEQILHDGARSAQLGTLMRYDGRLFLRGIPASEKMQDALAAKAVVPPGTWEVVGTVYATQSSEYTVLVPTLADSTGSSVPTVYFVSAHSTTPSVFYESSPDSGFSVDNVFPAAPTGFAVHYAPSGNQLSWNAAPEPDFQYYRIYRGSAVDFVADAGSLIFEIANNSWLDGSANPFGWFYRVSTVDDAGNESAAVAPATVTDVPPGAAVTNLALHANVPNPFNPRTTIAFDLPDAGPVRLVIFNAAGRAVRTLVQEDLPAGRYSRAWNGRDDSGNSVASGVFFARLVSVNGTLTQKMSLVR